MFRDAVLTIEEPELLCDGVDCVDGGLGARPGLEKASDGYCVAAADSDIFLLWMFSGEWERMCQFCFRTEC